MKTVHIVSHTHWDREWYLTFQQFRLKLVHLVDGLLDLLAADPAYRHFMLDGQTIVLDDYLHMRPEMEPVLREHVQSGRVLIGPWHILPDMFLVSPEAHIRNLLQGARTAQCFGPKMTVGYIPDPFGHPGQVPQILRGFGIESAALWRGVDDQPCEFWWESPDGSRVLMAFLRDSYGNGAGLPAQDPALFAEQLAQARDSLAAHAAADALLVMMGTDHMEPSPHTASAIAAANERLPDTRVLHSTIPNYLAAVRVGVNLDSLPVVSGELRACSRSPLLPGVLSARMWIKQRNQACETLLEKWAEPFSVFAGLSPGGRLPDHLGSPAPVLRQAWRLLMENHPHDSICGCSIDQVHDEMRPRFDQVDQIGEEITRQSLQAIAGQVRTLREGAVAAVVVFNPTGELRSDLVAVEMVIPENFSGFEIVDAEGKILPHANLGSSEQEFANILLKKKDMIDMIGNIHEGRVAGMSILQISVTREGHLARVQAVLDEHAEPNRAAWELAEREMAALKSDETITDVHVLARTPRAAQVQFLASDVPGNGWRAFWALPAGPAREPASAQINPLMKALLPLGMRLASTPLAGRLLAWLAPDEASKPPFLIENETFRVEASAVDGTLTVTDLRSNTVYPGLNHFVDGGDAGDEYNFSPPQFDFLVSPVLVSVRVTHQPAASVLEIRLRLRIPEGLAADRHRRAEAHVDVPVLTRVTLAPGVARIDVHTEIDNQARDHRLRVHFPAPFSTDHGDHDGHFEVVRRPIGTPEKGLDWVEAPRPEVPQRAFTSISNGDAGLMVANRGLPEVEVLKTVNGTDIALTLLRCVGWLSRDDLPVRLGHAGPGMAAPGAQMPGRWAFDYAIIPHSGSWQAACQQAYAFGVPLRAAAASLHEGLLPVSGSFIDHTPQDFVISTVKEAEDGKGWIVRGCNTADRSVDCTVTPHLPFSGAALANMAEEPKTQLYSDSEGAIHFRVPAHEVVTLRFNA